MNPSDFKVGQVFSRQDVVKGYPCVPTITNAAFYSIRFIMATTASTPKSAYGSEKLGVWYEFKPNWDYFDPRDIVKARDLTGK